MDYISLLRQFRIGPFAIFDTVLGYLGIFLLSPLLTKLVSFVGVSIPRSSWLWWMFPISVLFHLLFRQNTPVMQTLAQTPGLFIVIPVLGFMTIMGAKNCSLIK